MRRWILRLYVVELQFLVNVDQDLPVEGFTQARTVNFERLKNHVAVA